MAGSAKRERQLAREHYERQQARRAARAAKQRRTKQVAAVVVAALALAAGVVGLSVALGDDEVQTAKPAGHGLEPPPARPRPRLRRRRPPPGAGCIYTKAGEASKDVGLPAYDASKAASYRKPFTATVKTDQGDIVIEMAAAKAPCTTNSFRHLATSEYYDDTSCHRLTTDNIFVLQCGDPTGSGSGGPGYQFGVENAPADGKYPAGTVAMANAGSGQQRQPVLPGLQGHRAAGPGRVHDLRHDHQGTRRRAEGRGRRRRGRRRRRRPRAEGDHRIRDGREGLT